MSDRGAWVLSGMLSSITDETVAAIDAVGREQDRFRLAGRVEDAVSGEVILAGYVGGGPDAGSDVTEFERVMEQVNWPPNQPDLFAAVFGERVLAVGLVSPERVDLIRLNKHKREVGVGCAPTAMRDWWELHLLADAHKARVLAAVEISAEDQEDQKCVVINHAGDGTWVGDDGTDYGEPAESWLYGWWELPR